MALTWHPDFCPSTPGCKLEVANDWSSVISTVLCSRHQALKDQFGLTDAQVLRGLIIISRRKERARWVIKQRLMEIALMDKENPGVPYVVDALGNFSLLSGTTGATRTDLRTRVATALASEETTAGAPTITVN
jgi:hypothetical protein